MNSDEIYDALCDIGNNPSRIVKEALLEEYARDSVMFKEVLKAAYDPRIVFNKVFKKDEVGGGHRLLELEDLGKPYCPELHKSLSSRSGALYSRIVSKDLRAGFAVKTVNKVFPGLVYEMPYMRCSTSKERPLHLLEWSSGNWVGQPKKDGLYAEKRGKDFISRQGLSLFNTDNFEIQAPGDEFIWQGELTLYRIGDSSCPIDRKESNGIYNSIAQGGTLPSGLRPVYDIWDAITSHSDLATYHCRLGRIPENFRVLTRQLLSDKEREDFRDYVLANKLGEGLVIKHLEAPWINGTSTLMIKDKLTFEAVLRIISMNPGNGKMAATFGSLVCMSDDAKVIVNVPGSSFTDEERITIKKNWNAWQYEAISVVFKEIISSKTKNTVSLFEPRYAGPRFDKEVETLEDIQRKVGGLI